MARLARLFLAALILGVVLASHVSAQSYTQLTNDPASDQNPTWSPNGQYVVFESNRTGTWQLFRMNSDGSGVTQLTFGTLGAVHPEISPNGQSIVFSLGDHNPTTSVVTTASVAVIPFAGGAPVLLTPQAANVVDILPTYSPDNAQIYFTRRVPITGNTDWSLYRIPAGGGTVTLFLNAFLHELLGTISPDGLKMAFMARNGSQPLNMYECPIANPTQITQLSFETSTTGPEDYSPDNTKILFSSRKFGGPSEMLEYDRATGQSVRLTFDSVSNPGDPVYGAGDYHPTDSNRFLYTSARATGNQNIWLFDRNAAPAPGCTLSVQNGRGLPGANPVPVILELSNDQSVAGLEFDLSDLPERITTQDIRAIGRGIALTVDFSDDGKAHVLAFIASGGPIPAGAGPILELLVSPSGQEGDTAGLNLSGVVLGSPAGEPIAVVARSGKFTIGAIPGDITADNLVDGGDLARLIEILLDKGAPPSSGELARADCNGDASLNVLDVICELDLIEPGSGAPSTVSEAGNPMVLDIRQPIRTLSLSLPAGSPAPAVVDELAHFQMRVGSGDNGRLSVILWDLSGGELPVGVRTVMTVDGDPADVRAWGEGGRALNVSRDGSTWTVGARGPEIGPAVLRSTPNPFEDHAVLQFSLPARSSVRVDVFDVHGALVRSLLDGDLPAGPHFITWDGRDDNGNPVGSGVYLGRVQSAKDQRVTRMVRLRQ